MKKILGFVLVALFAVSGTLSAFEPCAPLIYPADSAVTVRIKAVSPWAKKWLDAAHAFMKDGKHKSIVKGKNCPLVGYYREDRRYSDSEEFRGSLIPEPVEFKIEGDVISAKVKFVGANYHYIVFCLLPGPAKGLPASRSVKFMTLDAETFKLRPYKGNLHQHSNVSDGKYDPQEHVAYARIAGFDFVGLSDHGKYEQNPVISKAAADSQSGLTVYPAEELHTPGNVLHGLSIGATKGYSYRGNRTPQWMKEVRPIWDEINKKHPSVPKSETLPWAESLLLAKRAKADGALLVYCHPSWKPRYFYFINSTRAMTDYLIRSGVFDVVEVINGSMFHKSGRENLETLARFHELCIELGKKIPVMSSSDSHFVSGPGYPRNYNVIFAPDCTFPSFKAAFLEGRAVASYDLDVKNSSPMNLGAFSFVCYANFLDEIGFWKKQYEYGKQQGELILKYLKGDKTVLEKIKQLAKQIEENRNSFYYQPGK